MVQAAPPQTTETKTSQLAPCSGLGGGLFERYLKATDFPPELWRRIQLRCVQPQGCKSIRKEGQFGIDQCMICRNLRDVLRRGEEQAVNMGVCFRDWDAQCICFAQRMLSTMPHGFFDSIGLQLIIARPPPHLSTSPPSYSTTQPQHQRVATNYLPWLRGHLAFLCHGLLPHCSLGHNLHPQQGNFHMKACRHGCHWDRHYDCHYHYHYHCQPPPPPLPSMVSWSEAMEEFMHLMEVTPNVLVGDPAVTAVPQFWWLLLRNPTLAPQVLLPLTLLPLCNVVSMF